MTRKCLVIEAEVGCRPVQVLSGQCLPPIAPVVGHPASALEVPLCPNDGGLVCEQLGGLFREPRCQDGRHQGEFLHPCGDILDRRTCWERQLPGTRSRNIIQGDVRHLHELQVQGLLDQLGQQEGHQVERASALQPRGRVSSDLTGASTQLLSPARVEEATEARRLSPCGTLAPGVNTGSVAGSGAGVRVPVAAVQGRQIK